MATAVARAYTAASGARIAGGIFAGGSLRGSTQLDDAASAGAAAMGNSAIGGFVTLDSVTHGGGLSGYSLPAWLVGKPLNEWFAISGTSGSGGVGLDAYNGLALKPNTSELISAAAGGHLDSPDNRAVSIRLDQDAPAWVLRKASTWNGSESNVAYYADGTPASRHTYQYIVYAPTIDAVVLMGGRVLWGDATLDTPTVNAFRLGTNTWDAAGAWPNTPYGYGAIADGAGDVHGGSGKIVPATKALVATPWAGSLLKFPICYDTARNAFFAFQYGDGTGSGAATAYAVQSFLGSQTARSITLTGSFSAWLAEAPAAYQAMTYDQANDRYLVYTGHIAGRVYVITPNASAEWAMSILTLGGGSVTPASKPAGGSGVVGRFHYIPALKGVALIPNQSSPIYFMRLA